MQCSTNQAFTDNNSSYQLFSYHKNHSKHPHITKIPKIQENWASQFVSPGGQHIAARWCIAENLENGSGGMSHLVGLQHRQEVFGISRNATKFNETPN